MRKLLLILLLIPFISTAQKNIDDYFPIENGYRQKATVFNADGKSASDIFKAMQNAITPIVGISHLTISDSLKHVISFNDFASLNYTNLLATGTTKLNYIITIEAKDGKFRVKANSFYIEDMHSVLGYSKIDFEKYLSSMANGKPKRVQKNMEDINYFSEKCDSEIANIGNKIKSELQSDNW